MNIFNRQQEQNISLKTMAQWHNGLDVNINVCEPNAIKWPSLVFICVCPLAISGITLTLFFPKKILPHPKFQAKNATVNYILVFFLPTRVFYVGLRGKGGQWCHDNYKLFIHILPVKMYRRLGLQVPRKADTSSGETPRPGRSLEV